MEQLLGRAVRCVQPETGKAKGDLFSLEEASAGRPMEQRLGFRTSQSKTLRAAVCARGSLNTPWLRSPLRHGLNVKK
eukprot:scaffold9371_cov21-Tisochrysis_lutea.AAC.3